MYMPEKIGIHRPKPKMSARALAANAQRYGRENQPSGLSERPPTPSHNKVFLRDKKLDIPPPDWSPFAEIDNLGDILEQEAAEQRRKQFGQEKVGVEEHDDDTLLDNRQY